MNTFEFLPADYKSPKSSNFYMKLQDGENKIRILSQPILGWEDWQDKKPIRYKMENKPLKSIDPKVPVKHFWSFIVWNYAEESIQILHITQATIRNCIEALCKDSDWGAPYFYDLKIFKKGEGKETEYMVNPLPHKEVSEHVKESFNDRPCNLEAIFINADPFSKEWKNFTPGVFSKGDIPSTLISKEDAEFIEKAVYQCDPKYQEQLFKTLKSQNIDSFDQIPKTIFQRIKDAVVRKRDEFQNELFPVGDAA